MRRAGIEYFMSHRGLWLTLAAFVLVGAIGAGLYFYGWGVLFGHHRPLKPVSDHCHSRKANSKLTFRLASEAKRDSFQNEVTDSYGTYFAEAEPFLRGSDVEEFYPSFDTENKPVIVIRFTASGADTLTKATSRNVGRFIVVAVAEKVVSVPRIATAIPGGLVHVSMAFRLSPEQAYQEVLHLTDQICAR